MYIPRSEILYIIIVIKLTGTDVLFRIHSVPLDLELGEFKYIFRNDKLINSLATSMYVAMSLLSFLGGFSNIFKYS